jgi:hypothetical protein
MSDKIKLDLDILRNGSPSDFIDDIYKKLNKIALERREVEDAIRDAEESTKH